MHSAVKKFADNGDLQRLKYVFVDCLDVDPTFEKYKEDFEYVKNVPGLIETNIELTPFRTNQNSWDEDYWIALKKDLAKNFSVERLEHMKAVAKVVHADKLKRILDERAAANQVEARKNIEEPTPKPDDTPSEKNAGQDSESTHGIPIINQSVEEEAQVDNSENKAPRQRKAARKYQEQIESDEANSPAEAEMKGVQTTKKGVGIAIAILVVIVIIVIVLNQR